MSHLPLRLPAHKHGLVLEHNEHRKTRQSAVDWVIRYDSAYEWKDDDAQQRAIAADEIWTLKWFPESRDAFRAVAAPTLEELLDLANGQRGDASSHSRNYNAQPYSLSAI